jgi:hypothetical protein
MTAHPLFRIGDLLHNRDTHEDGTVRQVYKRSGVTMYEVWIPKQANSWKLGHYVSDWVERVLELSTNKFLDSPE